MTSEKKRKLELTVSALQDRWGLQAIRRLGSERGRKVAHVPTGYPDLDDILAIGGLPRGRISEIFGTPTAGMVTMAMKIGAGVQKESGSLIYVDLDRCFDPAYAAHCGLEIERMILVRPDDTRQALAIMADFILGGGVHMLIFDVPAGRLAGSQPGQWLATTLDRIIAPLGRSKCILLFLTSLPAPAAYPPHLVIPHYAALRLLLQRRGWLYRRQDIHGYQVEVLVVKNKLGPAGKKATIMMTI